MKVKEKPPIIQYVRGMDKRPIGVVVATGREEIGIALCNPKDDWNKELGLQIAIGRAKKYSFPEGLQDQIVFTPQNKRDKVLMIISNVRERAKKYYKK